MFSEKILFRKRNVDQVNLSGKLFLVVKEGLNFVQICVRRELFWQADRVHIVQEFPKKQHVIVRRNVNRQPVYQSLKP